MPGRDERAQNRAKAPSILSRHGVSFSVHNEGAHIVIEDVHTVDFWPGPALWIWRGAPDEQRYGIDNLLKFLGRAV